MKPIVICALYKFTRLDDHAAMQRPLLEFMLERNIRGTLLLAVEGINGTVAGSRRCIDELLDTLKTDPRLADLEFKESFSEMNPFYRTKVRLKKEIVTMGIEGIDPLGSAGNYVDPKDWNGLISDPATLLIDTRNAYEIGIGTFRNAVNPNLDSFREFPDFVHEQLDPARHKQVAMFCTGGIRCEKSTAYLKELGFENVFHLKGGILKYLETIPKEASLWEGECFVFDNRVSVGHGLAAGQYDQCHACRMPISEEDKQSEFYEKGISCPFCYERHSHERRKRFMERERQIRLARNRGEEHIGGGVEQIAGERRRMKRKSRAVASQQHDE